MCMRMGAQQSMDKWMRWHRVGRSDGGRAKRGERGTVMVWRRGVVEGRGGRATGSAKLRYEHESRWGILGYPALFFWGILGDPGYPALFRYVSSLKGGAPDLLKCVHC